MLPNNRSKTLLLFATAVCFILWNPRTSLVPAPSSWKRQSGKTARRAASGILSWTELASRLPSAKVTEPLTVDSAREPQRPPLKGLVLFRERNGWCPYSERVWLALEAKRLEYQTVLIDNMGSRPRWFSGQTPQIRWEGGGTQGESLDIIRALDKRYPDTEPLWPNEEVTELVNSFRNIFPSGTRPSSRAAYLFKGWGGTPVSQDEFEATLSGTEELLSRYQDGPFLYGSRFSAADCAWAPFLERYAAQLPCLHAGLEPRDPAQWPRLAAWFQAMMQKVPAYAGRVRGDDVSWRRVLAQAGFGNAGVAPVVLDNELQRPADDDEGDWGSYAANRPYLAATPREEAAARLVRNRDALAADAVAQGALSKAEVDEAMRGVATLLCTASDGDEVLPAVVEFAQYLDERMCVPRDMGILCAREVRDLAAKLCEEK